MALQNPQRLKLLRRIQNLDPSDRAILNTVALDEAFATKEIRARLSDLNREATRTQRERSLGLQTRRFTAGTALKRKATDIESSDRNIAELLAGAGVIQAAHQGFKERGFKLKQAALLRRDTRAFGSIFEE